MKTCYKVVHSYKIYQCLHRAGHEFGFCWTNPVNKALNWRSLQPRTMVKLQFRLNLNEGYFKFTINLTLASNCKTLFWHKCKKNLMVVIHLVATKWIWLIGGTLTLSHHLYYHVLPLVHLLSTYDIDSSSLYCSCSSRLRSQFAFLFARILLERCTLGPKSASTAKRMSACC